jgi:hypothetical protein
MAEGTPAEVAANPASLTGRYLAGALRIPIPRERRRPAAGAEVLRIVNARGNNLQRVTVEIPVGLFTCVTGVSGSGKSTLVNDTLYATVARRLYNSHTEPEPVDSIEGLEAFDKVINVDQSPIGRTPRSNPATYTGLFTPIRELFAEVPAARERGYGPGRFSFNVAGGRCEACQGDGVIKVEMHFLPDVYVPCDVCHAKRYNRETLEILYKGRNITEVLNLTVEDAHGYFSAVPNIARQAADAARRRPRLHPARPERDDLVGRRGAARQAGARAVEARHRPHALHPRRADHRAALRRHRPAAEGAAPAARRRQHDRRDRAQPRRDQDRRLADRHGPGRRRRRRHGGRGRARRRTLRPIRRASPAAT